MSRFANANAMGILRLPGGCQCDHPEGTEPPHPEGDWIRMRTELGGEDYLIVRTQGTIAALLTLAVAWNLLENGEPAPVDRAHVARLFDDNFEPLDAWIEANVRVLTLPKASVAPSPNGSTGSDYPVIPTIPTRP